MQVISKIILYFQKTEAFEHRMYSHPLHKDPKLSDYYDLYLRKAKVDNLEFTLVSDWWRPS